MIKLPQFYNVFRFALLSRRTRWERLVLAMKVLDQLEHDYHDIYPLDPPVMEGGFEETLRQIVIKDCE